MEALPISEQFRVEAAKGWVLLGNCEEAHKELNQIGPRWRQHPEVLELRWYLHAEEENWDAALRVADGIRKKYPERLFGWLAHAHSVLKATADAEAAWKALLPAAELFDGPQVAYGLACYASLSGRFDDARQWLDEAMVRAGTEESREDAVEHLDLETLRQFIEKL